MVELAGQDGPRQVPAAGLQGRQTIPWQLEGQKRCLKDKRIQDK